jgi:hypothetical protein
VDLKTSETGASSRVHHTRGVFAGKQLNWIFVEDRRASGSGKSEVPMRATEIYAGENY